MTNDLLHKLNESYKKCSNCILHQDYLLFLNRLNHCELTKECIDFLCEKSTSKKHIWEIRFEHLKILLLNKSAQNFDLKDFYLSNINKCRRLALKLFYIRGYAIYATEEELNTIMNKFCSSLEKNHDYIDYEHILSVAGLPYLAKKYQYECFKKALKKAENEYQKIDPLLRGYFTINENLEQINILSTEEVRERTELFLKKLNLK